MSKVFLLDVGHGNCTIVRDQDATAVIDCPTGAILLDTLDDMAISTVETAIISHADKDHIAGIVSLLTSDRIRVERVLVNPDSQKASKIWEAFRVAVAVAERKGSCEVITSLSTTTPGQIAVGAATIDVLSPSAALALTGVGGTTVRGRIVDANTLSAALRISVEDGESILLAADIDDVALDEAVAAGTDLRANILVFPHHGGRPGSGDTAAFASRILDAVDPTTVVFSNGRGRHDTPRPEIVATVVSRPCAIACTQLSQRCQATNVDGSNYLETLRASGRDRGSSCAGSMTFELFPSASRLPGAGERHGQFIDSCVTTPMCRKAS